MKDELESILKEAFVALSWRFPGKPRKFSVMIAGVPDAIRSQHIPNISLAILALHHPVPA
jgi:hypothetical protein